MKPLKYALVSLLSGLLTIDPSLFFHSRTFALAQDRQYQLIDMECKAINPPLGDASKLLSFRGTKALIGNSEFDEVAILHDGGPYGYAITKDSKQVIINCPVSSGNNLPFRSLKMSFGLDKRSERTHPNTVVRMGLLFDGNIVDSVDVRSGVHFKSSNDITGVKSIGLTVECVDPDNGGRSNACPGVSFTRMTVSASPVSSTNATPNSVNPSNIPVTPNVIEDDARNTILLTEMKCTGGINGDPALLAIKPRRGNNTELLYININHKRVREIASISSYNRFATFRDRHQQYITERTETSCKIPPYFQKLSLAFGIDDKNKNDRAEEYIELSAYVNGQLVGKRQVKSGKNIQTWNIPLSNPRLINLEAKCVKIKYCSRLSFTKLTLE
jgi:hypothetical protein